MSRTEEAPKAFPWRDPRSNKAEPPPEPLYTKGMARFVLVHGAHGGAWCWEPVVGPLAAAGHAVEAFDLPGSGGDHTAAASVTLAAYVERTCAVLAGRPEPAVLVGHSMG